ncbi:RBBP9/YdeN family alpha/beta hydrolase [Chromobacterium alticapitis]|uniref:Alpha/beta hydrolase n=1 Tax=Chromobacterium alticapitis TaxID=2073169 RepID=A0A2S5DJW5_9NEIS|nr:alpha/beta hydrolase [Chromobacterium alticapitis]POZ63268.1 alpha/beta hydrolase [Chromobacterium alticapitis]
MWDDDDVTLLTVPGWGDSGPAHWQSRWELTYPLARRVVQQSWLYPSRDAWVAGLAAAVADIPGQLVIAAHSLGCHATVAWLLQASLADQRRVKGALLVAPPALPILPATARASGELPDGAALPDFAGFEAADTRRLPVPAIVAASHDDPFCDFAEAARMADGWGADGFDAGNCGHMGSHAGLGSWPAGQSLLQRLILG